MMWNGNKLYESESRKCQKMIMIFTKKLVYVRTAEKIRRCQTVFSVMIVPRKEENDTETAKKRKG